MNSRLKSIGDTNILLDQPHSGIYLYFVNNNLNNFFISRTVFTFHALDQWNRWSKIAINNYIL